MPKIYIKFSSIYYTPKLYDSLVFGGRKGEVIIFIVKIKINQIWQDYHKINTDLNICLIKILTYQSHKHAAPSFVVVTKDLTVAIKDFARVKRTLKS